MSEESEDFIPESLRPVSRRYTPIRPAKTSGAGLTLGALLAAVIAGFVFWVVYGGDDAKAVALAILFGALYFLPSYVAIRNQQPNALAICVLNLLLGWTFIGWAVAMVWAFLVPEKR